MSKVLIADDSATIRGVAESLLRHNGYEVISTSDGAKALAMAKSQNPDLIFLDYAMPGKDGLAVCLELKADPHTRNIPVLMLLGAGEARDAEKFLAAGASDYLFKPFVPTGKTSSPPTAPAAPKPDEAKGSDDIDTLRRQMKEMQDKLESLSKEPEKKD